MEGEDGGRGFDNARGHIGRTDPAGEGSLLVPGQQVDNFLVRRLVGEGGMGRVYLARDIVLGRPVALKVLHRELFASDGVEDLLREARAVGRFSHPNIVHIYGVGRVGDAAYLALEYLDGSTLRERLNVPWTPPEVMRLGASIASALREAHGQGLVHADLKPENIIIPSDGRPRVVDFGLAQEQARTSTGLSGTVGYIPPEQWLGAPPAPTSDVWALGVILFEALEGRRPYGGGVGYDIVNLAAKGMLPAIDFRADCAVGLADVLRACLSFVPASRPTATTVHDRLEAELSTLRIAPPTTAADSPFRGLGAFDERHATAYVGRESEVAVAMERLRAHGVLPIVGPSGAGKSSFMHAGLVARMREAGTRVVVRCRPGAEPFRALALRLSALSARDLEPAGTNADEVLRELEGSTFALALHLERIAARVGGSVMLVVDQLEEIFTYGAPPDLRRRFLESLALAGADAEVPVRVCFAIREDFLGALTEVDSLRGVLSNILVLRTLDRGDLRRVIEEPVRRAGFTFERATRVDDIIGEVVAIPNPLPLLQFVLAEIWTARDIAGHSLPETACERVGGVAGALARHAESLIQGLSVVDMSVARDIMLRLLDSRGLRREQPRDKLLDGLPTSASNILERLVTGRLLTVQQASATTPNTVVELAHESLTVEWPRLGRWLGETREESRLRDEVEDAARLWERRGRRPGETWTGDGLREFTTRLDRRTIALTATGRAFLDASALEDRRRLRSRRMIRAVGAATLLAMALGGTIAAVVFRAKEREAQRQRAEINAAAAEIGRFELELRLFDWDATAGRTIDVRSADLPDLRWALHSIDPQDRSKPGPKLRDDQARVIESRTSTAYTRVDVVEARGGASFLAVAGRGHGGQRCGVAWVPLQAVPGFADRSRAPRRRLTVWVPTCAATYAAMVDVPAGDVILGGRGEPASQVDDASPERVVYLDRYLMDRTEVTNAAYAVFARMSSLTGEPVPRYPNDVVYGAGGAWMAPVSGINAFEAETYCRFMGKELPSDDQWVKAGRGGMHLDGAGMLTNAYPRRNYPWGPARDFTRANLAAIKPTGPAAVGHFPGDVSPYGVLDLAGNLLEWTSSQSILEGMWSLRAIRGGSWNAPAELDLQSMARANTRDPRFGDYSVGFRCALSPDSGLE